MSGLSSLFVDPSTLPGGFSGLVQLAFLAGVYGFILLRASALIAAGSELLTLVLDPGFVGGFLLPVLGAVPDGAIVLFSGLGPDAAQRLAVGVGTLAGSTVLLLTLPWAACTVLGRVDLAPDGSARYAARPKLTRGWGAPAPAAAAAAAGGGGGGGDSGLGACCARTGVQTTRDISLGALIMLATAVSYLVVQLPAWAVPGGGAAHGAALAGLLCSVACFITYSLHQVFSARSHELQEALQATRRKEALAQRLVEFTTVLQLELESEARRGGGAGARASAGAGAGAGTGAENPLLPGSVSVGGRAGAVMSKKASVSAVAMRCAFDRYDADKNGVLSRPEVRAMFKELGIKVSKSEFETALKTLAGDDELMTFDEFQKVLLATVSLQAAQQRGGGGGGGGGIGSETSPRLRSQFRLGGGGGGAAAALRAASLNAASVLSPIDEPSSAVGTGDGGDVDGDDDDEGGGGGGGGGGEDELDEETAKLTPVQIKWRAYSSLLLAILLVTLFSDPMCDVISELGVRLQAATGLQNSAFYIAFVVTPVISNATEIISSVLFAGRRTQKSIVITFSQLLGAVAMNNSFCLAIFLAIVYIKNLDWDYSAEVVCILFVEVVMCAVAYVQKTPLWHALIPLALYPASLGLVYGLERAGLK